MKFINNEPGEGEEQVSLLAPTEPTKVDTIKTILVSVANTNDSEYVTDWIIENLLTVEDVENQKITLLGVKESPQSMYNFADEFVPENEMCEIFDKKVLAWYSETLRHHRKKILSKFSEAKVEMIVGEGN
jgi:hypothetical protein